MLKKVVEFRKRLIQLKSEEKLQRNLESLLLDIPTDRSIEDQLTWLVGILKWMRQAQHDDQSPLYRLKVLLRLLDRNPTRKKSVALVLRSALAKLSGFSLYTETGLPREWGVWSEFFDRLLLKFLPSPPLEHNLSLLFSSLFPDPIDREWTQTIDGETFNQLTQLLNYDIAPSEESHWNRFRTDLTDSLRFLVIQIRAIGLTPALRERMNSSEFKTSAFYDLSEASESFLAALSEHDMKSTPLTLDQIQQSHKKLKDTLNLCRRELTQVHNHLNEFGVSVNLVFQMTRVTHYLQRVEHLAELLSTPNLNNKTFNAFLSDLITENQDLRSLQTLFSQNLALIARKIVERAAETGEHYITRTKSEYKSMLYAASGGGVIAGLAVYAKLGLLTFHLGGFLEGFGVSLIYATAFLSIHFLGFTLGTKQAAMTAPALAEKMQDITSQKGLRDLVIEISHLFRSQVASVLGNVFLVIPFTALINLIVLWIFRTPLLSLETAHHAYESSDIIGPSFIYAGFTGVLLWLSSIVAGWGDNWFALHSLKKTLARSPTVIQLFGKAGARSLSQFLQKNMSAIVGNVTLAFMLGLSPAIFKFLSLPLDVRHVTISGGNLGAALPTMGFEFLKSVEFWRSFLGVFVIGAMNVILSFGLALVLAIKARGINAPQRKAIRRGILHYFRRHPMAFFLPVSDQMSGVQEPTPKTNIPLK